MINALKKRIEELKTLNDLPQIYGSHQVGNNMNNCIDSDILRQEAIKWIKAYMDIPRPFRETNGELFMSFFNITEEDLKY